MYYNRQFLKVYIRFFVADVTHIVTFDYHVIIWYWYCYSMKS